MKNILALLFIFSFQVYGANLVFSFNKSVEYDEFKTKSTFVLLDNGRFSFKTSTGGFHLCSGGKSGEFNGQLTNSEYKELLSEFLKLDESCEKIKSCSSDNKKRSPSDFDWTIFGWGKYVKKKYFFTGGTNRPKLFETIFNLEKKLYQDPEVALEFVKIKETKNDVKVQLKYNGKKSFNVDRNEAMFVKIDKTSQRRLTGHGHGSKELKNGESIYFSFDKKKHALEDGDYLVFSPPNQNNLNPCVAINKQ